MASRDLKHPHILGVAGRVSEADLRLLEASGLQCLAMPFCGGGDLNGARGVKPFSASTVIGFGLELLLAVFRLHSRGVAHRDLKLANIVIDDTGHLRVCDFGNARRVTSSEALGRDELCVGTVPYMSLELLLVILPVERETEDDSPVVSPAVLPNLFACDMWSVGCVLFSLFAGVLPFNLGEVGSPGLSVLNALRDEVLAQQRAINSTTEAALRARLEDSPLASGLPAAFIDVVLGCLRIDPAQRLTARTALAQPMFRDLVGAIKSRVVRISSSELSKELARLGHRHAPSAPSLEIEHLGSDLKDLFPSTGSSARSVSSEADLRDARAAAAEMTTERFQLRRTLTQEMDAGSRGHRASQHHVGRLRALDNLKSRSTIPLPAGNRSALSLYPTRTVIADAAAPEGSYAVDADAGPPLASTAVSSTTPSPQQPPASRVSTHWKCFGPCRSRSHSAPLKVRVI